MFVYIVDVTPRGTDQAGVQRLTMGVSLRLLTRPKSEAPTEMSRLLEVLVATTGAPPRHDLVFDFVLGNRLWGARGRDEIVKPAMGAKTDAYPTKYFYRSSRDQPAPDFGVGMVKEAGSESMLGARVLRFEMTGAGVDAGISLMSA